ncbi:unnamed protein product, partial [Agarophyton chilense]
PAAPPSSPAQLRAARKLLQRYYALSAEALQHAAASDRRPAAAPPSSSSSPSPLRKQRTPAERVFRLLPADALAAPACIKYLIVGGGTAAWAAIDSILHHDPRAANQILLVSDESYLPYNRTMLSKELFDPNHLHAVVSPSELQYAYKHFHRTAPNAAVSVANDTAVLLDPDLKLVQLASGRRLTYDKLLLATGGAPRPALSVTHALQAPHIKQHVSTFRTLQHYQTLRATLQQPNQSVAVVGGGFLGTELALALTALSDNVSLVITEPGVLFRVLPRYLCQFLATKLHHAGVNVVKSAVITTATPSAENHQNVTLHIDAAEPTQLDVNHIVVAVGIEPSTQLATTAGLEIDPDNSGIRVNDFMMVEPDIFAAGDVASFHDRTLGRRRVEHWDHAVVSGSIAGANMTGARERYQLQSMFWSDLSAIDVHFTAVGLVDSALQTLSVWNLATEANHDLPSLNQYQSGVVYYLNDRSEIVGVVLWNPTKGSGALRRARALVDAKTNVQRLNEHTLAALVNLETGQYRHTIRTKSATG